MSVQQVVGCSSDGVVCSGRVFVVGGPERGRGSSEVRGAMREIGPRSPALTRLHCGQSAAAAPAPATHSSNSAAPDTPSSTRHIHVLHPTHIHGE